MSSTTAMPIGYCLPHNRKDCDICYTNASTPDVGPSPYDREHQEIVKLRAELAASEKARGMMGKRIAGLEQNSVKQSEYCEFLEAKWADSKERIAELEARLEVDPKHAVDGIQARDATITLLEKRIAELEPAHDWLLSILAVADAENMPPSQFIHITMAELRNMLAAPEGE